MSVNRMDKVNSNIKEVVSEILRKVKDPRLSSLLSITDVITSKDLRSSRIYVSLMTDSEEEKKRNLAALKSASGYIRKELGRMISLKSTPELNFYWDNSIENGVNIIRKIEKLKEEGKF